MNAKRYSYPLAAIVIGVILISAPFVAELLGRSASERTTMVMMAIGGGALLSALTGFVAQRISASVGKVNFSAETSGDESKVTPHPQAARVAKARNAAQIPDKTEGTWTFYQPALAPAKLVSHFFDPDISAENGLKPGHYSDVLYFVTFRAPRKKHVYFAHRDRGIGRLIARSGNQLVLQEGWDIQDKADKWLGLDG